jgi:hypothetical protein
MCTRTVARIASADPTEQPSATLEYMTMDEIISFVEGLDGGAHPASTFR